MHRKPGLFSKLTKTVAEHMQNREHREGSKLLRLACELVGWGCFGAAAGMVALPLGLAVGGIAFFAFSLQLR